MNKVQNVLKILTAEDRRGLLLRTKATATVIDGRIKSVAQKRLDAQFRRTIQELRDFEMNDHSRLLKRRTRQETV